MHLVFTLSLIQSRPNCSYSKNDTQSVGRVHLFTATNLTSPKLVLTGRNQFEKFGSMVAVGDPYQTGHSILAVGSDTEGKLFFFSFYSFACVAMV